MSSTMRGFSAGLYLATIALVVLIVLLATGGQSSATRIITKEIIVPQSAILFTDQQRINFFVAELLTPKSASCFKKVLTKESHYNAFARNPTSGATGVSQLLASTYRNLGFKKSNDAIAESIAGLAYISERYGSAGPCGAWKHEQKWGWY